MVWAGFGVSLVCGGGGKGRRGDGDGIVSRGMIERN